AFGRLRPEVLGGTGEDFCDLDVLRTLRRRSLAALRAEVEPVPPRALGVFLPRWQGVQEDRGPARTSSVRASRGPDAVLRAVEQLAGAAVPASALETLVLPARVPDYRPAMLDELTAAGEVLWAGSGALAARDGLVTLHPTATADLTLPPADLPEPDGPLGPALHAALLETLDGGGAFFLPALADRVRSRLADDTRAGEPDGPAHADGARSVSTREVLDALWDLVWAGLVTNDGVGVLRARLAGQARGRGTTHPVQRPAARARPARLGLRGGLGALRPDVPPDGTGRWSLLPERTTDPTLRAHALA